MRKAEIIFGIVSIALAAVFFVVSASFPTARGHDVGMAFYPRILVVLIVLLSLVVILESVMKMRGASVSEEESQPLFETAEGGVRRVLLVIGLTLVYAYLLGIVGFVVVTPLYLLILMASLKAGKLWKMILISVATTLVIYVAFRIFLRIPLPIGIFRIG